MSSYVVTTNQSLQPHFSRLCRLLKLTKICFPIFFFRYRQGLLTLSQPPVKPPLPAVAGPINIPTSPLAHHNYTWTQQSTVSIFLQFCQNWYDQGTPYILSFAIIRIPAKILFYNAYTNTICLLWFTSQMSPQKHVRLSPRPSTSYAPYPSPTYSSAIAAAQHNVHLALGTTPNSLGANNGGVIHNGNITIHQNHLIHQQTERHNNHKNHMQSK